MRDRLLECGSLLCLCNLTLERVLSVLKLLLRLAQALSTLFQLGQFEGPDLIGVEQALLLTRKRGPLALETLEFALGVGQLRTIALLLLPEVPDEDLWLLQ